MGFSFLYDANKENRGKLVSAVVIKKNCALYKRPIKKLKLLPKKIINILKNEGNYYLIDFIRAITRSYSNSYLSILELFDTVQFVCTDIKIS